MAHGTNEVNAAAAHQQRVSIAFLILAWVFISLRVWTRTFVISNFGWDDGTMILAGMMFTAYCGALLYIDSNGGGTHVVSYEGLEKLTKWVVISETSYLAAMMTVKISIGLYFARIVVERWHLRFIYVVVGVNVTSAMTAFFYCIFRCGTDVSQYALMQLVKKCAPPKLDSFMAYQSATFTTLTDLAFVALPIALLWNANMSRRSKVSVGFVLMLATLGCICSMIRFQYVDGLTIIEDFFWNSVNVGMWSCIEAGAGIMAGCAATLRPLVKRLVASSASTKSKSGGSSRGLEKLPDNAQSGSGAKQMSTGTSTLQDSVTSDVRSKSSISDKPGFLETLIEPGEEGIEMTSHAGHERGESQDTILGRDGATGLTASGNEGKGQGEGVKSENKAVRYPSWLWTKAGDKISQRHSSPGAFYAGKGDDAV